jgi:hypothetical protein
MLNKIVLCFFSIAVVTAVFLTVKKWVRTPAEEADISPGILSQKWIEESVGEKALEFRTPVVMKNASIQLPKETSKIPMKCISMEGEGRGISIFALYLQCDPSYSPDLGKINEAEIAGMRHVPGTASISSTTREYYLKGNKVLETDATVRRENGKPLRFRSVLIRDVNTLWGISLLYKDPQPIGEEVWNKIKQSINFS